MKTALITTTINVPHVLKLYRKFGPQVQMFVAGDVKSPPTEEMEKFCDSIKAEYRSFLRQEMNYPKLSAAIGPSCIQRRNIALLEAVKWGAEIVISIDDDNIPTGGAYFAHFDNALTYSFSGVATTAADGFWFDPGSLLDPEAPHRGFPEDANLIAAISFVTDARVGVAAGMCLGDPDIDAAYRRSVHPEVHRVSELLRAGVVVQPPTRTVFNSQNTAVIRELAPAFFMAPGLGRYDDIFASLICQRVMREKNLHVHFGPPFVWQSRNPHNLVSDLRQELFGMENTLDFTGSLDKILFSDTDSILTMVRTIWSNARIQRLLPEQSWKAALAFLEDMEAVL